MCGLYTQHYARLGCATKNSPLEKVLYFCSDITTAVAAREMRWQRMIIPCTVLVVCYICSQAVAAGWRQGAECLDSYLRMLFSRATTTYNSSLLARCDVVSARCCRLASKSQEDCYLSTQITTAVARTLEPSDLMLTCCLSAANAWLVSRPTNSLSSHCCCWAVRHFHYGQPLCV